jgi:hypothetical protein
VIQRRLFIPTFLCLSLAAGCSDPDGDDSSASEDEGLPTATVSASGTSGDGDDNTDSDPTTDNSDTSTSQGDGDGDTDGSCESDEDCGQNEICVEGTCEMDCGTATVQLEAAPPPVMLVLDKSGSMVTNSWDHDGDAGTPDETRWATLYSVTDFILTNFESTIQFGLQLFPDAGATTSCANDPACPACGVSATPEVDSAIDNRDAVLAAMPAASTLPMTTIAGATPAAGGITNAKAALDAAIDADPSATTGALIFITDGAANCGLQHAGELCEFPGQTQTSADCKLMDYFDDELEPLIGGYYTDDNIATYVVGIDIVDVVLDPDSEFDFRVDNTNVYEELNAIAIAGGVPQTGSESFYNATNEAELMDALNAIAGEIATCDIDLTVAPNTPPPEAQIPFVKFLMMDMQVPGPLDITAEECDMGTEDGWIWVDLGLSVRFCGTYCDQLKETGEVDGVYECPPAG